MKFTKEEAVEKLNHVLTNGGKKPLRMSAKTLESQVETLLAFVSDEEMELDAFVDKVKAGLSAINSNIEHDNSDFIKKYKEDHPEPNPDPKPKPKPSEDDPNADLIRRLAELEKKEADRTEKAAIEAKRAEIRKYLSDNNVKNGKWIDSVLKIATIGKEDDVEELGKTYLGLYNESLQGGAPVPPGSPAPGDGGGKDTFAELREMRKRRAENEK